MKKIMVVDDSRVVQIQLSKILEGTDFEIAAYCRTGEEAIQKYTEVQPDLITMDIIMPGMDGLEAARAILQEHPEACILIVSSLAYDDTMDEAKEIGAKGFVYKPFEREQILDSMTKALSAAK